MFVLPGFWVAAVSVAGSVDFRALLEVLGRPERGGWSRADLARGGLEERWTQRLLGQAPLSTEWSFLTLADPRYPARLLTTAHPPPVLFYRGDLHALDAPTVSVVGSRTASGNGLEMARRLARTTTAAGATVVSGLARGIDQAAHEQSYPRTVAVLGQGLDVPLSGTRRTLADRIGGEGGGLVLSEFLPAWGGSKWTFPRRNRIIAALGDVTVVVEAGRTSGALITARWALDFGREVFAVPGSPIHEQTAGCLDLLDQGASLARDGTEILRAIGLDGVGRPTTELVIATLGLFGADLATLSSRTGLGTACLQAELQALELTGRVHRLPGGYYLPVR